MASIQINSANVLQACEKAVKGSGFKKLYLEDTTRIRGIKILAKFSEKLTKKVSIDHDDIVLIGEYLTLPSQPGKK